ncbi:hypothetical protein BDZ45DRAFT_783223 [Acephala macrosclerotiorum]|nr:hypothetical protein BDZ45DRAFT_783223 [Acephala macrosclerotiorum]
MSLGFQKTTRKGLRQETSTGRNRLRKCLFEEYILLERTSERSFESLNQFLVQRLGLASYSRQSSLSPAGNTLTLTTPSTPSRKSSTDSEDSPSKMQDSEKYVLVLGLQMPLPGALGALWFKGDNVTTFLEQYDDMCEDYRVTPETKRIRLLRYISPIYKEQIRFMLEYSTENYLEKEFYDVLKKEFREHDWEHYRVSIEFLYRIIDQSTRGLLAIKTYVDLFDRIFKELIKRNKLNKQYQGREFIRGLSMHIKERIFRETDYESIEIFTHNYDKMYEKAIAAYKYKEKKRRYNEINDPEYSKVR